MRNRLQKQIEFIVEIDKLKSIFRRSYITDSSRRENDAEHSWHIALMTILLSEYSNNKNIDVIKVMKMLLIHDIVEIDAGDVIVYDESKRQLQEEKEKKAAQRLFSLLPADQKDEIYSLWIEFEKRKTDESKFARALDRLQPILLNYHTEGKAWREAKVTKEDVLRVNSIVADGSEELWNYIEGLIEDAFKKDYIQ